MFEIMFFLRDSGILWAVFKIQWNCVKLVKTCEKKC
jgi:hypothetical protein